MRTTVTLEDDLYVLLEKRRAEAGKSFKEALNEVIRAGLRADTVDAPHRREARRATQTFDLGQPLVEGMDSIGEVLAIAEGDGHK
jgi:hypothetical protein